MIGIQPHYMSREIKQIKQGRHVFRNPLTDQNTALKGQKAVSLQIKEQLLYLKQAIEMMQLGVIITNLEGKIVYINPAAAEMHGFQVEELLEQPENLLVPPEFQKPSGVHELKHWKGLIREKVHQRKDGTRFPVWLMSEIVQNFAGEPWAIVTSCEDITERKRTEEQIQFFAYHDTLTGLPNRTSFYMSLRNELKRSYRRKKNEQRHLGSRWALLFLDLDRFKYVNDTLGHNMGDMLLKQVASRLRRCIRQSDHIFRLGGDEFTILLTDLSMAIDAARVAEKIIKEMMRPYTIQDNELYLTVSIGISVYPDDGETIETLVKNADMAMYAAKDMREGYRFFTEDLHQKAFERMQMERRLRTALEDNQFKLYYQPLVDRDNQIVGMEALLRWHHPELGVLSPSQFIPLAEETGLIVPIGDWVLLTACQQTYLWHKQGFSKLYVSVNLSPRQFNDPHLEEKINQILHTTGLDPQTLNLEVTESGIMEHPDQAIAQMMKIRARGVHFAIDDFGTGYSSLSYLKRFPITTLKIDRSFVSECMTNKDDQEIIKTIIAMARNLNLQTIAEGIETKAQYDFLIAQGSDLLQGYYVGHPLSVEEFEERLLQLTIN